MPNVVDLEEQTAQERIAEAQKAEKDLLDQLQERGLVEVWRTVKAGLHCEKFIHSPTGKAFVDTLMRGVIDSMMTWLLESDPCSDASRKAHMQAQAAHMALFTLDKTMREGDQARDDLDRLAREIGE